MSMRPTSVLLFLSLLLFQGCSGLKPYPEQKMKNISILTEVDSGSFFSSVDAAVDIYTINTECKQSYEGTLALDKDSISSGIKINKQNRLSFIFSNSSFLGNSDSSTSFPVYLDAQKDHHYHFVVSYKDNIYNVVLYEINTKTKKRREIDTGTEQECQNL